MNWIRENLIALGIALVLIAIPVVWHFHAVSAAYDDGHAAAITERAAQDLIANVTRNKENEATAIEQRTTNFTITKAKNEELAPVLARVDAAPRLRRPAALCDGTSLPAQAPSAAGSDSANPSGWLGQPNPGRDPEPQVVREDIDRDFRAYKVAVETDLATGRTCQAFLDRNGLTP